MRRISTRHARLGMALGRTVYDNRGYPLLELGIKITRESLSVLIHNSVPEIFVEDLRTNDVVVHPVIAPELEAVAAMAVRRLATESRLAMESQSNRAVSDEVLRQVQQSLNAIVRELFPTALGEPNVTGCLTQEDYIYVQPAKVAGLSMLIGRRLDYGLFDSSSLGLAALLMNLGCELGPEQDAANGDSPGEANMDHPDHPRLGAENLGQYDRFEPQTLEGILQHHERWDGSGYPGGLRGAEIAPFARIIAIADTYFELVSKRPDREAYMPHEAVEYILAYSGELFDPELVLLFSRLVPLYPTGMTVKLNTGELGIVADANMGHIGRPVVRICSLGGTHFVDQPYDINLSQAQDQNRLVVEVDPFLAVAEG